VETDVRYTSSAGVIE